MKKIISVVFVSFLLISLCGCFGPKINYTYEWTTPVFKTLTATQEFEDFTITYPVNWSVGASISIDDALKSNGMFFTLISSRNSNMNIIFSKIKLKFSDITDVFVKTAAKQVADKLGSDVSVDGTEYASIYGKDMIFIYMSSVIQNININFIEQIVPVKNGSYIFTYGFLPENKNADDIKTIADSVKFK